jgi:ribosomal protein L37AE/L43A
MSWAALAMHSVRSRLQDLIKLAISALCIRHGARVCQETIKTDRGSGLTKCCEGCYALLVLGIDIALLVGGAVLVVAVASLIGGRYGARGEVQRRRKQGERNAEREKQRLEEQCAACGEPIDPDQDVWEAGSWWHKSCYREAVR